MCKQAIVCMLLIAGLTLLLLCFTPTWIICVLGILMIAVGIVLAVFRGMMRF